MRLKLMWVMLGAAIVAITTQYTKPVLATSAAGFVGTTLARGRFGDINVFSHLVPRGKSQQGTVRRVRAKQRLGPGGQHRLAHASRP
jgi:hypothetical protein